MTIDNQTKVEKLQYNINREAAKISVLSSGKIDKYLTILLVKKYCHLIKKYILDKAKVTYFPLGKAF